MSCWKNRARLNFGSARARVGDGVLAIADSYVLHGEAAMAASRVRSPIYALFSIGAPTLLPHSVHEPS